jgi:hypothetical protein
MATMEPQDINIEITTTPAKEGEGKIIINDDEMTKTGLKRCVIDLSSECLVTYTIEYQHALDLPPIIEHRMLNAPRKHTIHYEGSSEVK